MYFFQSRNQTERQQQQQTLGTQKPTTILRRIDMMTIRVMPENRIVDKHQAAAKHSIISTILWAERWANAKERVRVRVNLNLNLNSQTKRYLYRLG